MKTPTLNSIKPPPNLSAEARTWWSALRSEYEINDIGGLVILGAAAEAFDRMREAQEPCGERD